MSYTAYVAIYRQTSAVTVANTLTETSLLTSAYSLPANYLTVDKNIRIVAYGFKSKGAGATITFRIKVGSVIVGTTGAINIANTTNTGFQLIIDINIRTAGATGTAFTQGNIFNSTGGVGLQLFPITNTATSTIDTTVINNLDFTVEWSAASATNTVTLTNATIEIAN